MILCAGCDDIGITRCGACSKAGIVSVYCGKKCQKILWKTHRNHCGVSRETFIHPQLEENELNLFGYFLSDMDKHMPGVAVGKLADSPNYSLNLGNRLPLLLYAYDPKKPSSIAECYHSIEKEWPEWERQSNISGVRRINLMALQNPVSPFRHSTELRKFIEYAQIPNWTPEYIGRNPNFYHRLTARYLHAQLDLWTVVAFRGAEANLGRYHGKFPRSLLDRVKEEGDAAIAKGSIYSPGIELGYLDALKNIGTIFGGHGISG